MKKALITVLTLSLFIISNAYSQNNIYSTKSYKTADESSHMSLEARIPGGYCGYVAVSGNYAFVGNGSAVDIIDVTVPSVPVNVSRCVTKDEILGIEIAGNSLVVRELNNIFEIFDISDPRTPRQLSLNKNEISGMVIKGNYLYVTLGYGIDIFDISDPINPVKKGTFAEETNYIAMAVSGNVLCLSAFGYGIFLYDISDPVNPVKKSSLVMEYEGFKRSFFDLEIKGNYVYCLEYGIFCMVDISDPEHPVMHKIQIIGNNTTGLSVSGKYACLAGYRYIGIGEDSGTGPNENIFLVIDTADPDSMKVAGTYSNGEATISGEKDICYQDGKVYIAESNRLTIIDVSDPDNPNETGYFPFNPIIGEFYIYSGLGYCNYNTDSIYDMSIPTAPVKIGTFPASDKSSYIKVDNGYAYTKTNKDYYNQGLIIYDVSDPYNPRSVGKCTIEYLDMSGIFYNNGYVYSHGNMGTSPDERMWIFDVRNPAAPSFAGSIPFDAYYIADMSFYGKYAYISNINKHKVVIADMTDPVSPVIAGTIELSRGAYNVWTKDGVLCLLDGQTVRTYDISDPPNPRELGSLTLSAAYQMCVDNNYAYTCGGGEIHVIDISKPESLEDVAYYNYGISTMGFYISVLNNYVYVSDGRLGLFIFKTDLPVSVENTENAVPSQFTLSANYPNPFNGGTFIDYTLPKPVSDMEIAVYNIQGQKIRTLAAGAMTAGRFRAFWDGRDKLGCESSSGVYICSMKANDKCVAIKRMMMVK